MEKAKRKVRYCLVIVTMIAIVVGIIYYYNNMRKDSLEGEGTLVRAMSIKGYPLCR